MTTLKDLFHQPAMRSIGGIYLAVYKIAFNQFDDALLLGQYIMALGDRAIAPLQALQVLKAGTPERAALERLLAGCLAVPGEDGDGNAAPRQLTPADIAQMPAVMVGLAIAEVLEINADFFLQNLPTLQTSLGRIGSIGLALPSSSLAPGTTTSPATPSPSSGAI